MYLHSFDVIQIDAKNMKNSVAARFIIAKDD